MISGRSSDTTYEQTENLKPGNTSSVTAAPPSTWRRSSTSTLRPARARYAAAVRPLWPPPMTIASYCDIRTYLNWYAGYARYAEYGAYLTYLAHPSIPYACRHSVSRSDPSALRELELSRLGGLLRCQRLRAASRARVQRHPQCGGADRRVAAVQISGYR